jgi:hypothetical protein
LGGLTRWSGGLLIHDVEIVPAGVNTQPCASLGVRQQLSLACFSRKQVKFRAGCQYEIGADKLETCFLLAECGGVSCLDACVIWERESYRLWAGVVVFLVCAALDSWASLHATLQLPAPR